MANLATAPANWAQLSIIVGIPHDHELAIGSPFMNKKLRLGLKEQH